MMPSVSGAGYEHLPVKTAVDDPEKKEHVTLMDRIALAYRKGNPQSINGRSVLSHDDLRDYFSTVKFLEFQDSKKMWHVEELIDYLGQGQNVHFEVTRTPPSADLSIVSISSYLHQSNYIELFHTLAGYVKSNR